jgi:hypothetical protein
LTWTRIHEAPYMGISHNSLHDLDSPNLEIP